MSINPSDGLSPEEIEKLQEIYRKTLPERLRAIKEAIVAVEQNASAESADALRFLVHKLAGNAGSFGYMEVSRISKELEKELIQLIDQSAFDRIDPKRLSLYFETIKNEFDLHE
jgi:HPt (histidine-containing phosphotransfer) domain-containing protein